VAEYAQSKSQIPSLYNEITKKKASEVELELTASQDQILSEQRRVDSDALDEYYTGLFYMQRVEGNALQMATMHFNNAIRIEPDWAPLFAALAEVGAYQMQMIFLAPSIAIPGIYENLNRALELNPNSSIAHYTKAVIAVWTEWDWEKGEREFKKSLEINPSNALCRAFYAHLLGILDR
jgi:Tfp pilus assembly protein PilF